MVRARGFALRSNRHWLIAYFASWIALHLILRGKNVNFARATTVALLLLVLGLLGTFPPFFSLLAGK